MSVASENEGRMTRAKALLSDPLLVEVLDSIEQAAITLWASTAIEDNERREIAYHSLKASRRVRETLQGIVDNGLIEASRAVRR